MKKPTRKKGEVLYAILKFISESKPGSRWSEIRDFMVQKEFTKGAVGLTLSRPMNHTNAVLREEGFCTKFYDILQRPVWRLNDRGEAKLKELRKRFSTKTVYDFSDIEQAHKAFTLSF